MKYVPIGIEDFKELIDRKYYYVDKTMLIKDIVGEKVVLYTRPRRFGKSLNMSMLNYYYNIKEKENAYLFEGLKIAEDEEVKQHQNKYPVIFISLKDMKLSTFEEQRDSFKEIIIQVIRSHKEVLKSKELDEIEKKKLQMYYEGDVNHAQMTLSLLYISSCLEKHYGEKVMILIDEYDVPLQYAYTKGYYEEMVSFIRNVFSAGLKTNTSLYQGILTGCLRIAKESIFTGMNNFKVNSIFEYEKYPSYGFTEEEVYEMLESYGLSEHMEVVKAWYDGYLFGDNEIYNPWSTMMYVDAQLTKETKQAKSYWANTSGNDIIIEYIKQSDSQMREEFEKLVNQEAITKKIKMELTYREMEDVNNIYSFLLYTGYLKVRKAVNQEEDMYEVVIPNKEVRKVYTDVFESYFEEYQSVKKYKIIETLRKKEVDKAREVLNDILDLSISYYDNKESFYHGFLMGLFQGLEVESNKESGDGRFDIVIYPKSIVNEVIVIECKHSKSLVNLIRDSEIGVQQIQEKRYGKELEKKGYRKYIGYGISFYKKQCYVTMSED